MTHCPQSVTVESLMIIAGSDNVCTRHYADSKAWDAAVGEDRASNRSIDQDPDVRNCQQCRQSYRSPDARRRYCSTACRDTAFGASLRRRQAEHRERFPNREHARQTLKNAIQLGKVRRCTRCEACGVVGKTHGHHSDYTRPFYVTWLCSGCHAALDNGQHFGCGKRKPESAGA